MSNDTTPPAPAPSASCTAGEPAQCETAPAAAEEFVVASHAALFDLSEPTVCDACGDAIDVESEEDGGYSFPGCGVYLWVRGDEVTREKAPLCGSCASAIGMTALARWEIEEEEG